MSLILSDYPEAQKSWDQLCRSVHHRRLPHVILFSGANLITQRLFVQNFAQYVLCQNSIHREQACGCCTSCQQFSAGHPDLHILAPQAENKYILIDQIRQLITDIYQTSQQGSYKIVILDSTDALQISGINALLKTLEEPPLSTVILLLSTRPGLLPLTLLSRCHKIILPQQNQLELPERLRSMLDDLLQDLINLSCARANPLNLAAQWSKVGLNDVFYIWTWAVVNLLRTHYQLSIKFPLSEAERLFIKHFSERIDAQSLLEFLNRLYRLRDPNRVYLNLTLSLEDLFCCWYEYTELSINYSR